MNRPQVVKFADWAVNLQARGESSFTKPDFSRVVRTPEETIIWDPGIDGLLGAVSMQCEDSDHQGERHLDGDELLYVISGNMRLQLYADDGSSEEFALSAGDALLVPRGRWHRLKVDEPTHYVSFGGGRTEIRGATDDEA